MVAVIGPQAAGVNFVETVDGAGVAIRYWLPASQLPTNLLIWSHPHAQTEQIGPGNFAYPIIHAAVQEGWAVVASLEHSNSWGNTSALTDLLNAYTFMTGFGPVNKVVLCGASMGGMATALAIPKATLPAGKVKGAFLIDGVLSLRTMYANATYTASIDTAFGITRSTLAGSQSAGANTLSSTVSYAAGKVLLVSNGTANAELVTVQSVSGAGPFTLTLTGNLANAHTAADQIADYGTQTATFDPILFTAGDFGTVPWRFYAGAGDATVPKASNADAFAALVANATERVVVAHANGHLATNGAQPRDMVAFVKRCLAQP